MTPKKKARQQIDSLLAQCGWIIQEQSEINLSAGSGVAVRQAPLRTGEADYLLFADGKAIGTVEIKSKAYTMAGGKKQSGKGLFDTYPTWGSPLPFAYERAGSETRFTSRLDPRAASSVVFMFHRPETLIELVREDRFWQELLAFIKAGRVIPVLGEQAVTFGEADQLLYPYLAAQLAQRLALDKSRLPMQPTLTDVACEWLVSGGKSGELYKQLYFVHEEFTRQGNVPGRALRAIASIPKFNLFLSTTFDSLIVRAVAAARPGVPPSICGFFPNKDAEEKDLPGRKTKLPGPTIYHLFGQVSLIEGEYVAWEEDILDFLCALHATLNTGKDLDLLSRDLADNALLVLGPNFSDLLVRFFLRVAKQSRLTELPYTEILTEQTPDLGHRGNVLFFGGVVKNVHVRKQDPVDFAVELARRWEAAYPTVAAPPATNQRKDSVPKGAIFISYARENEPVARALCEALKEQGCVVWYDRERLLVGGYWPDDLQEAVKRDCGIFIALISETTETEEEGYWRRERDWAIERAPDFYPSEFYIPVWIDNTRPPFRSEPEKVRDGVNAAGLPAPGTDDFTKFIAAFSVRLRSLQIRRSGVML